jgi:peptide-methionine (S)-S-oxide reductase
VIRTRVGYAGGTTPDPTYRKMGDHTETIEIDFESTIISYEQILQVFWENHNPQRDQAYGGRQYMSLLLYHNETQKEVAERTKKQQGKLLQGEIQTKISPYESFYLAEDYHQKYYLKRYKNAMIVLGRLLPTEETITNATVVARLNGLVRGFVTPAELKREMEGWNISEDRVRVLKDLVDEIRW